MLISWLRKLIDPEATAALETLDRQRMSSRKCNKARRDELIAAGLCPDCRGRALADPGHITCGPCREVARVQSINYRASNPPDLEVLRKQDDKRRERVKAAGLCCTCRHSPADEGYSSCTACRASRAEYARSRRKERKAKHG